MKDKIFRELVERMMEADKEKAREALREKISKKYGGNVVAESRGVCKVCGKEKDLRYGYCFDCAPDSIKKKVAKRVLNKKRENS